MFALVRHAHAGDKRRWEGPDDRRPLSPRGLQQAEGVAENLRAMPATRLLSSPYLRCLQTLRPLSARHGIPVIPFDLLRPGGSVTQLDLALGHPRMEGAVLCTHGETLNELFAHWRTRGVLAFSADDPESHRTGTQKGAVWIVEADGEERIVHYLGPLHVGPALADADV